MTAAEERELKKIERLLAQGAAKEALAALDALRENGSAELLARDAWRLDEQYGAAWYALGDGQETAAAYWDAASHDRFLAAQLQHYSSYLFCLHYADLADEAVRQQHEAYGRMLAGVMPFDHEKRKRARLRIGYLSPSFREHTVSQFCWPLFADRDRARYEVYGYELAGREDAVTAQFRALADDWRVLDLHDYAAAAAQIAADQLDILVDLGGHTEGGQTLMLLAYRPAPVQVCGIGWFDTTGLPAVDYILTDGYCASAAQDGQFVERPLRLEHTHLCYTPAPGLPELLPYAAGTGITFASFHNYAKITDAMLTAWARILAAVPGSRLLLKDTTAYPERQTVMAQRLLRAGFAPGAVELQPGSEDYRAEYQRADILLDTYPYPGGGMTCEALYMGVPVISRYGRRHGTRFGLSLLANLGLAELAADSEAGYVAAAVALAQNRERLAGLHASLRRRMRESPLMDHAAYMWDLERGYEMIWDRWLKQPE